MASTKWKFFIVFIVIGILVADCDARKKKNSRRTKAEKRRMDKLRVLQLRETSPINFSRLVAMRVIYGVASWMGIQDRLSGVLNGAFVPPGADEDDYGGIGGGFDDDYDDGDGGGFDFGSMFGGGDY